MKSSLLLPVISISIFLALAYQLSVLYNLMFEVPPRKTNLIGSNGKNASPMSESWAMIEVKMLAGNSRKNTYSVIKIRNAC